MMSRIIRSAMVVFGLSVLVGIPALSGSALAGHISDAVKHAKSAVSHGKEGHADACAERAEVALRHAQGAKVKSPHLDEGIKRLREAVEHGKAGHADACTEHADGAATHLAEVKGE